MTTKRQINWVEFCRNVVAHTPNYWAEVDYEIITGLDDQHINQMADRLYMLQMSSGHREGISAQALEWISTEHTR